MFHHAALGQSLPDLPPPFFDSREGEVRTERLPFRRKTRCLARVLNRLMQRSQPQCIISLFPTFRRSRPQHPRLLRARKRSEPFKENLGRPMT